MIITRYSPENVISSDNRRSKQLQLVLGDNAVNWLNDMNGQSTLASYSQLCCFIAEEQQRLIGTVTAIFNPRLQQGELGQLAYFICDNNNTAAQQLLAAAEQWLREQGCRETIGPMHGGFHRPHRLQISPREWQPVLGTLEHPMYYNQLFQNAGYTTCYHWYNALWELRGEREALYRRQARQHQCPGFQLTAWNDRTQERVTERLYPLLLRCWQEHPYFSVIEQDELADLINSIYPYCPDDHLWIATDTQGQDAGFTLLLQNPYCEQQMMGHSFSVTPEYRHSPLALTLFRNGLRVAYEKGYQSALSLYSLERVNWPRKMARVAEEYALYSKALV